MPSNQEAYIPEIDPAFVPWGEYKTVERIISTNQFFPVYISGLSGGGKSLMVEQACAALKREYVRVQMSPETDESDLIGQMMLVDGSMSFKKGPVITAMERGSLLLIDEVDRASNKLLTLQGVMEGKPVLIKKTGEVVRPAPGFNVIATANTKGRGSDDGRYSAANIIDDAFMERFVITIDQPYPDIINEKKIVNKHRELLGINDYVFVDKLCEWAQSIRKTYEEDGIDEMISTRRLCHIIRTYSIFPKRMTAINKCIARFDEDTRSAFSDLYVLIDKETKKEDVSVF